MYRIKYIERCEDYYRMEDEIEISYSKESFKSVVKARRHIERIGLSEGRFIAVYSGLSKTLYIKCEVEKID